MEKSESKSKLSATTPLTLESITKDLWENICGDRNIDTNIPVNESSDGQIDREVVKYDKIVSSDTCEEAWLNSEGDFVKQEDIAQNVKLLDNVEAVMTITDVICEDKVEKLITEEKPNALTENMEECDNFDVEEFIKDKLNKITDSIMVLSEETSIGQLQNEPIISTDNVEKENIESSNYKTSRSKPSDVDKNMPPATKVINSIAVLDEATNQEQLQNESIINIGQKEKPESNSDNQHEFLEIDIEIPVPNHVIDSIIVLDEEANPTQSQNKKKLELSSPNGRQSEPLNVDKRTQVRYKVIDSTQADNETNLEQAQNELKIEKDMFISCNYNNQELEHTDLCRIEVRNKKNEPITLQDEDTNLEQMQNEPIEKEKQFEPSDINKQVQVINRDDSEYTEHFEKILKRVEDVYFQLDEIQESVSMKLFSKILNKKRIFFFLYKITSLNLTSINIQQIQ